MSFWMLVALMAACACASVLLPLWRSGKSSAGTEVYSDQLRRFAELEQDVHSGDIASDTAPLVRAELERAVLDAVTDEPITATNERRGGAAIVLAAVLVPLVAIVLYLELGQPGVAIFTSDHPDADLAEPHVAVEILLEQVRDRVASNPEDLEAWTVLARTNLQMGRFAPALAAAERVAALAPDDTNSALLLIDALAMQADGRLGPRAVTLIDGVLEKAPDNPSALVLKGIAAEQLGDHESALSVWRRALTVLAQDAPIRAELEALLGSPEPASAELDTAQVTVTVTIAADLASQVSGDTAVYVIARATNGPAVPLAVARRSAAELPLTVTLDASMAMVAGASLADYDDVYVVARVTRTGEPRAVSGDFEGRSTALAPGAHASTTVHIEQVVP